MAFNNIDRQNAIITFVEAVMDPVGREDRVKDLTIKNYDKNLLSKTSAETPSSEDWEEELNSAKHE